MVLLKEETKNENCNYWWSCRGMSAATRLRRLNEQAEIIVLEKGPYVSFANCGLPYYVAGD